MSQMIKFEKAYEASENRSDGVDVVNFNATH